MWAWVLCLLHFNGRKHTVLARVGCVHGVGTFGTISDRVTNWGPKLDPAHRQVLFGPVLETVELVAKHLNVRKFHMKACFSIVFWESEDMKTLVLHPSMAPTCRAKEQLWPWVGRQSPVWTNSTRTLYSLLMSLTCGVTGVCSNLKQHWPLKI